MLTNCSGVVGDVRVILYFKLLWERERERERERDKIKETASLPYIVYSFNKEHSHANFQWQFELIKMEKDQMLKHQN